MSLGLGLFTSLLLAAGCGDAGDNGGSGGGGPGGGGSVAGSGGSVASSGTGGELPDRCTLPQETGPCDAAIPSYWHDPSTGECVQFTYGGCDGNENRFESLAACQEACQGTTPAMDVCAAPGDCVLAPPQCCASCDPVDASAFVAIHRDAVADFWNASGCGETACTPCQEVSEAERTAQYFAAACEGGRCVVVDVRESPLTECTQDADCALRDGVGCCESCDGRGIVALNQSADLGALVCPQELVACPPLRARVSGRNDGGVLGGQV
ncbi:BPTI/Kunitz domain-containing protein [Sorangium cellulosum]|uniref:BPTI/Kunitz domain-containing protein n=1 Tax=Sorangium cellulosum TaxID=56 RepID=UPI001F25B2D1|nr:BPTI/Kunitz domain-containing protein [Sorangium cellulosum]